MELNIEHMVSVVDFEGQYVHTAYELLANYIDLNTVKRWPIVEEFLSSFPPGSLLADMGCGEGKYMDIQEESFIVGSDRSNSLLRFAQANGHESLTCDLTKIPFRKAMFDGIVCIAVVHHLATEQRRIWALKELARILRPGGKLLLTAWALENKYRKFSCQDVLIPTELPRLKDCKGSSPNSSRKKSTDLDHPLPYWPAKMENLGRNFHPILYGELESIRAKLSAVNLSDSFKQYLIQRKRSFWLWLEDHSVLNKLGGFFKQKLRNAKSNMDLTSHCKDLHLNSRLDSEKGSCTNSDLKQEKCPGNQETFENVPKENDHECLDETDPVLKKGFQRYYHVFQKGELASLLTNYVPSLRILEDHYEQGNWVLTLQKRDS